MRPQRLVGLIIILASLIPILTITYWYKTRIFVLLDQPISLAQGHITTPEFKSNLSGDYLIEIHLDRYEMGTPCQDYEILRTNWILSSNGKTQDSSANPARV